MILDRLENAALYRCLGPNVALALDYLAQTDFSKLPNGRHELDSDQVYAVMQRGPLKPLDDIAWEAHRLYIDIQYVVEGTERMGYAPLDAALPVRKPYDPEKDYALYDAKGNLFSVSAGSFAIFMPHDIHAPSIEPEPTNGSSEICKVVMKCRVK